MKRFTAGYHRLHMDALWIKPHLPAKAFSLPVMTIAPTVLSFSKSSNKQRNFTDKSSKLFLKYTKEVNEVQFGSFNR